MARGRWTLASGAKTKGGAEAKTRAKWLKGMRTKVEKMSPTMVKKYKPDKWAVWAWITGSK